MSDNNIGRLNVALPTKLRKRAHDIAKKLRTTTSQLIRDALAEKLDNLEVKEREEQERLHRDKEEQKKRRGLRSLNLERDNLLAPSTPSTTYSPGHRQSVSVRDDIEPLYEEHARRIIAAINQPTERRLRFSEAISAIKKRHPLTSPNDQEILTHLESAIVELRTESTSTIPAATVEAAIDQIINRLTARSINPKIPTYGDVDDTIETVEPGTNNESHEEK